MPDPIPFIDLKEQRKRLGAGLDEAIARVLEHGRFILGPEVAELEGELANFCGAKHCITCANGTDALVLLLMAEGIGEGDAVFVPAFTFVATAEAVCLVGATPVFCDVHEDTFNLDADSLAVTVPHAKSLGLNPRAVIPVDLFGQPADYPSIQRVADEFGLSVIADAAQSFGGELGNQKVGKFGKASAVSFFPAKPLGCYGDGGAIFTDDDTLAETLVSLRMHGEGGDKYVNVRVGQNSRLDTLQAAILLQKLTIFGDELDLRQQIAMRYTEKLDGYGVPIIIDGAKSAWAQYTILSDDRDELAARAKSQGIPTAIYYPRPLSLQTCYANFPSVPGGVPVSERLSAKVISLPMHPYLDAPTQDRIIESVKEAVK